MKRNVLFFFLLIGTQLFASPLWMRYNAISPQGDKIAFCYKGDVYVVDVKGGRALKHNHDEVPKCVQDVLKEYKDIMPEELPKGLPPIRHTKLLWLFLLTGRRYISQLKFKNPLIMCSLRLVG